MASYDAHDEVYPDGYCGGDQTMEESVFCELDRIVYPERPRRVDVQWQDGETYEQLKARRKAAGEAQEARDFAQDREPVIAMENVVGSSYSGPPRSIGQKGGTQ